MSAFAVEHRREGTRPTRFVPDTRLVIAPALRTEGFLAIVPDREFRALVAVLTFLTADGRIQATADQVARALGISEKHAAERLRALCRLSWRDTPVLAEITREQAPTFYAPGYGVVTHAHEEKEGDGAGESVPYATASREELIARSRDRYAKPLEEVERIVAGGLGHGESGAGDGSPDAGLRRALLDVGLTRDEADELLAGFPRDVIQKQLDWLPARGARNPARYLVAAIRGDYAAPVSESESP